MELPHWVPSWILWLVSGLFLFLPFLYDQLWLLAIGGIALWLYVLSKAETIKSVFWGSLIVGLGKYAGGIYWFWETYPVEDVSLIASWQQLFLIGYFWVTTSSAMALGLAVVGLFFYYSYKSNPVWLWLFPFLFVIGEILSSVLFSIYSLGSESTINASFSFGYSGYLLADSLFLFPVMAYFGVYGLSFVMATLSGFLFLTFSATSVVRNRLYVVFFGFVLVLILMYALTPVRLITEKNIKIIAIETNFPKELINTDSGYALRQKQITDAVDAAIATTSDIVLLPEDSRFTNNFSSEDEALAYLSKPETKTKLIVDSFRKNNDSNSAILRALYYDVVQGKTFEIDKQYLVPIGEYVMNFESVSLKSFGQYEALEKILNNQNYIPGPKNNYEMIDADLPGILFCFESVAPLGVKEIVKDRKSEIILHPVSHAWFHNPVILWRNLDAMLQVQAIWNDKTIVTTGNMSPSKIYYPNGVISTGKEILKTKYWRLVEYNL